MSGAGLLIAAPASGSGKTAVTCGLLTAFQKKGLHPAACKCGPDYIDPMFHREALGVPSENLDLFFCGASQMKELYRRHAGQADITLCEGVMGYYDGITFGSWEASSYDVAKTLSLPVILLVSGRGAALSIVPQILGMLSFQEDSRIRGILLNRVSKELFSRMKALIEEALSQRGYKIPVVGYVPEHPAFSLESRHLGLVLPGEIRELGKQFSKAGEILTETVDLDLLLQIAAQQQESDAGNESGPQEKGPGQEKDCEEAAGSGQKPQIRISGKNPVPIAVARDEAFCFYYQENIRILKELGCEPVYFSPLRDRGLPEGIGGLLLGGGYPELYGRQLEENSSMRASIKDALERGLPCIAECGGFLYLLEKLETKDQGIFSMVGFLPGRAFPTEKLGRFGYILLEAKKDGPFLKKGETIRGHEFHYWDTDNNGSACTARKPNGARWWECVHEEVMLFGGFPHLYLPSNRNFARRFVDTCRKRAQL